MRSIITMVSISLEGFMPSILLLVVIIIVVIVAVILVVVVIDAIVEVAIVVASIRVVVVVKIIGIVVIVDGGVSHIIKLSFVIIGKSPDESFHNFLDVCLGDPIGLFYSDRLSVCIPPRQGIIGQGIYLGLVFLLGLSAFAMAAACTSRAATTPSVISCQVVASVVAGVADVDVHLGAIYQHIHANT
nr:hypothetical protein [Tanacetum cinerariifolium]